jgi:hypothetical protein
MPTASTERFSSSSLSSFAVLTAASSIDREHLPGSPDREIESLAELPALVGA